MRSRPRMIYTTWHIHIKSIPELTGIWFGSSNCLVAALNPVSTTDPNDAEPKITAKISNTCIIRVVVLVYLMLSALTANFTRLYRRPVSTPAPKAILRKSAGLESLQSPLRHAMDWDLWLALFAAWNWDAEEDDGSFAIWLSTLEKNRQLRLNHQWSEWSGARQTLLQNQIRWNSKRIPAAHQPNKSEQMPSASATAQYSEPDLTTQI